MIIIMNIKEGYINFKNHQTYYRIVGEQKGNKKPLILLHGGPGSTHNYFEVFDDLATLDDRMIIMYDQIGCGNSFIEGHPEYFTPEVWLDELQELRKQLNLDEVHILGQSWGGMMCLLDAIQYKSKGVKSYILSSTLPSSKLWEKEQHRRISYMPEKYQKALNEALKTGDYENPNYLEALNEFMERHSNPKFNGNIPECALRVKRSGKESYLLGWGPNEFTPTGTLAGFDVIDQLHEINVPCLIMSGQRDLCSPYIAKTMFDNIPNSKWELFEYSGHMPFLEEHEKYTKVLIDWLNNHD